MATYTIAEKMNQRNIETLVETTFQRFYRKAQLKATQGETALYFDCLDQCAIEGFSRRFFIYVSLKGFLVRNEGGLFHIAWDDQCYATASNEIIHLTQLTQAFYRPSLQSLREQYMDYLGDILCTPNTIHSYQIDTSHQQPATIQWCIQQFQQDGFQVVPTEQSLIIRWENVKKRFV